MNSHPVTTIFFDLDDTLYPPQRGVWGEIARRINRYMIERVGIRELEVDALRRRYFTEYGTACNGLRHEHGVEPEDFYRFVHDIPLGEYLAPDPALRRMLEGMPQKKIVFSNADRAHIQRVLSVLNVSDLFEEIVDIFATGFACKPMDAAYRIAMRKAGSPPAECCMLVDDLPRNLQPAHGLGWTTVLIHNPAPDGSADHQIETIYQLSGLLD
ncbi:MAG: pyrimidine 5'-nucleotidase [Anaerolineales bacterium]